jgi:flagellar basal body-associated protein FliL
MKIIKGLVVLLLVAAVIAVVVMHEEKTGAKRVTAETENAAESFKDATTDAVAVSVKAMSEAATNVAAKVKETIDSATH